jgi:hypothetical protein
MFQFDANAHKPKIGGNDPIPAGWVVAAVTNADYKPTSQGTGHYLAAEFTVLSGEHKGRKFFVNYNLDNPSQKARDIAAGEFSALCHGIGVLKVNRPQDILNKPVHVRLGVKKDKKKPNESQAEYDAKPPRNVINELRPFAQGETAPEVPAATAAAPGAVQGTPTPAKAAPSWAKKKKGAEGEAAAE